MLPKRPKAGDTENDLLRFQQDFLSSDKQPAAVLVHKAARPSRDVVDLSDRPQLTTNKQSKFQKTQNSQQKHRVTFADKHPEEAMEVQDTHITKVLSEIVERDVSEIPVYLPEGLIGQGFPIAPHRGDVKQEKVTAPGAKKKSLFAQQFAREPRSKFGLAPSPSLRERIGAVPGVGHVERDVVVGVSGASNTVNDVPTSRPTTIDGSELRGEQSESESESETADLDIHEQNLNKLSEMSREEIFEEQQRLKEAMDPALIAFLKSRKAGKVHSPALPKMALKPAQCSKRDMVMETDSCNTLPANDSRNKVPAHEVKQGASGLSSNLKHVATSVKRRDWLNMSDVETEKLAWMTDLQASDSSDKPSNPARFDFEGHLITCDADEVPTHLGLHHHGSEPERAGYSLEELFTLARSVNTQQRIISLSTISQILLNAQKGAFTFRLRSALTPTLLDSGLIFLLRWALDDSNDGVIWAAVSAMRHLVVNYNDHLYLDQCFSWPRGYLLSSLSVEKPDIGGLEEDDDEIQNTDADIVKHDLIKGLLRMDILPRLRYIVEVCRPSAPCVIDIIHILARIAQHSLNSAYQVYKCPRLLPVLVTEFLPTLWSDNPGEDKVYGYPVASVIRLFRFICQTGRNITSFLISQYDLMTVIMRYLAVEPLELNLNDWMGYDVQIESYRLWSVCLIYGHGSEALRSLFPVLMKSLSKSVTQPLDVPARSRDLSVALIGLLEAAMLCAADGNKMADREDCTGLSGPSISWHEMCGIIPTIQTGLHLQLQQFINNYQNLRRPPLLLCICMRLMARYYDNVAKQPGYDAISCCQKIQKLMVDFFLPLLESVPFRILVANTRKCSNILRTDLAPSGEYHVTLPCCGATVQTTEHAKQEQLHVEETVEEGLNVVEGGTEKGCKHVAPVLRKDSPFNLLVCLTDLTLSVGRLDKSVILSLYPRVLCADVEQYVRRIVSGEHSSLVHTHFTRIERHFLSNLIKIVSTVSLQHVQYTHYHQMALWLLPWLQQGDQFVAMEILSLMFKEEYFRDIKSSLSLPDVTSLSMDDVTQLRSSSGDCVVTSRQRLLYDVINNMDSIKETYRECLCDRESNLFKKSRSLLQEENYSIHSLHTGRVNESLVPIDWIFIPIVNIYQQSLKRSPGASYDVTPSSVRHVTDCLRFVYLLETCRRDYVISVTITTRISRIICCFLAGSDLFLELAIHCCLSGLLREYTRPININLISWQEKIPGLVSFYDLYVSLLEQYESVSFGDSLFSCYLLLPLQQRYDIQYKRAVWNEFPSLLRILHLPINQVLLPLENFMMPEESDSNLLFLYARALSSSMVRHQWSPLMYLVAVHHVNRYMYATPRTAVNEKLLDNVRNINDETIRNHVIHYKDFTTNTTLGFTLYQPLPPHRQSLIDDVISGT